MNKTRIFKIITKKVTTEDGNTFPTFFTPVDKPTDTTKVLTVKFKRDIMKPTKCCFIEVNDGDWFVTKPDDKGYIAVMILNYKYVRDFNDTDFDTSRKDEFFE